MRSPVEREGDVDGIVHAAGHAPAPSSVSPGRRRKMCAARVTSGAAPGRSYVCSANAPLRPVDPAIGSEVGPVEIVRAASERLALKPLLAAVRDAVAVGVRQLPDARRRRDIERSVEPQRALRETSCGPRTRGCVSYRPSPSVSSRRTMRCGCRRAAFRPCRSIPTSRRRRDGPRRRSRRRWDARPVAGLPRARPSKPSGTVSTCPRSETRSRASGSTSDARMRAATPPARDARTVAGLMSQPPSRGSSAGVSITVERLERLVRLGAWSG